MAELLRLGVDTTNTVPQLAAAQAAFEALTGATGQLITKIVSINAAGEALNAQFKLITKGGSEYTQNVQREVDANGTLTKSFEVLNTTVTKSTQRQKEFKDAQLATIKAIEQAQAIRQAKVVVGGLGIPTGTIGQQQQLAAATGSLAKIFITDLKNARNIADDILAELGGTGPKVSSSGLEAQLRPQLLRVLTLAQKIQDTIQKPITIAQQKFDAAFKARDIVQSLNIPGTSNLGLQQQLTNAQSSLAKALLTDLNAGQQTAHAILLELAGGPKVAESNLKNLLLPQLQKVLLVAQKITEEFDKPRSKAQLNAQGKNAADQIVSALKIPTNLTGLDNPALVRQLTSAQTNLANTLVQDFGRAKTVVKEVYNEILTGNTTTSNDFKGKVTAALLRLIDVGKRANAELTKAQETAARATRQSTLDTFQSATRTQFPIPTTANLADVVRFESAYNNLFKSVGKGKIDFQTFQRVFSETLADPNKRIQTQSQDLINLQTQIKKVVQAYGQVQFPKQSTDNFLLSLNNIVKILQVQLLHRFFGNILTDLQTSTQEAIKFEKAISEILTIGQRTGLSFNQFSDSVAKLAAEFNRTPVDVAAGVYQALSNQVINTAKDMGFMNEALRLARITVSSTPDAVNALSSVINSYNLSTSEAGRLTDQFFHAVDLGRFRLSDVANSLGRVTAIASQLGITFEEVAGFLTFTTRQGISISESMTQLSAVTQALLQPSQDLTRVYQILGVETGQQAIQTFRFVGAISEIIETARRANINIQDLTRNVRAFRGISAIQGGVGGLTGLQAEVDSFTSPQLRAQAAQAGEVIAASFSERFTKGVNEIQTFMTTSFGPKIIQNIVELGDAFGGFANLVIVFVAKISTVVTAFFTLAKYIVIATTAIENFLSTWTGGFISLQSLVTLLTGAAIAFGTYKLAIAAVTAIQTVYRIVVDLVTAAHARLTASTALLSTTIDANGVAIVGASLRYGNLAIVIAAAAFAISSLISESNRKLQAPSLEATGRLATIIQEQARATTLATISAADAEIAATNLANTERLRSTNQYFAAVQRLLNASQEQNIARDNQLTEEQRNILGERTRSVEQQQADARQALIRSLEQTRIIIRQGIHDAFELSFNQTPLINQARVAIQRIGTLQGVATNFFDTNNLQEARDVFLEIQRITAQVISNTQQGIHESERLTRSLRQQADRRTFDRSLVGADALDTTRLTLTHIDELRQQAFQFFNVGNIEEARKIFEEIDQLVKGVADSEARFTREAEKLGVRITRGPLQGLPGIPLPGAAGIEQRNFQDRLNAEAAFQAQLGQQRQQAAAIQTQNEANRLAAEEQFRTRQFALLGQANQLETERSAIIQTQNDLTTQQTALIAARNTLNNTTSTSITRLGDSLRSLELFKEGIFSLTGVQGADFGGVIDNSRRVLGLSGENLDRFQAIRVEIERTQATAQGHLDIFNTTQNQANFEVIERDIGTINRLLNESRSILYPAGPGSRALLNIATPQGNVELAEATSQASIALEELRRSMVAQRENAAQLRLVQTEQTAVNAAIARTSEWMLNLPAQFQAVGAAATTSGTVTLTALQQVEQSLMRINNLQRDIQALGPASLSIPAAPAVPNLFGFARGGLVTGPGGIDNIFARLTNHEFVMNPAATAAWLPQLVAMNSGARPSNSSSSTVVNANINVNAGSDTKLTVRQIGQELRREIKRGTLKL